MNKIRFHVLAAVTCILLATSAALASPPSAVPNPKVDAFVSARMKQMHIPGLSIAVVRGGKVIYAKGYGWANIELSSPAKPETVYPIGSLSKQFTAAAVMLLVQGGKLKLDAPFPALLPTLKLPASWGKITVRNLLNQTSGIPAYTDFGPTDPSKDVFWKTWSPQEIVGLVTDKPLAFDPGSRFEYSNTNYYLLGQAVAAVDGGKDVYQFLHANIFSPLEMTQTDGYDPTAVVRNRASRYLYAGHGVVADFIDMDPSYYVADGGIESSALDLAKWDAALYKDAPLTADTKKEMWTAPQLSQPSPYGFGWVLQTVNGHALTWHNGAIAGAMSWMGRYADDKLTVIVLCNILNVDDMDSQNLGMRSLGKGIAALYDPALTPHATAPARAAAGTVDPADLAICKNAFDAILAGTADPAIYTDAAAKALFPDRIAQTTALFKSLGAFQKFEPLGEKSQAGSRIVTCRATFEDATLTYDFYLEAGDNKIQGIIPQK